MLLSILNWFTLPSFSSTPNRQSYDVEIEVSVDGTNIKSTNSLDLKNPYFRYTGSQTVVPAGTNTVSPTELYWNSSVAGVSENGLDTGSCGALMGNGLGIGSVGSYSGGWYDLYSQKCCLREKGSLKVSSCEPGWLGWLGFRGLTLSLNP